MDEIQKPAQGFRQRLFRRIGGADDRSLEHSLHAETRKRRFRGKNALFGIAYQNRRERAKRHLMRLEDMEARLQGEDEAVSPSPERHLGSLARVLRRQLVVERDDDCLLAGEIAIEEADADPGLLRDIAKRCRVVATGGDELDRRGIQAVSCRGTLGGPARWTTAFSGLDILSEHVH